MKTKRPISINNSLVHGICNYNCRLCGVNKKYYKGPRAFQPLAVTKKIITETVKAANNNINIRYITNSGDGEPTLHPDFQERMNLFGSFIRTWSNKQFPPPEVSVVSNGLTLHDDAILQPFIDNPLTLIVSFPSAVRDHYNLIMTGKRDTNREVFDKVELGLAKAMQLCGKGEIRRLLFHISPPEREFIRKDFNTTVTYLTDMADNCGLNKLEMVLFPATSNRSGLVSNKFTSVDFYRDIVRKYNNRKINNVHLTIVPSIKRFFPRYIEIFDLLRSFSYPCLWNSQLFITPDGSSICCNDQAALDKMGNIMGCGIRELVEHKEQFIPGKVCRGCDQVPTGLHGSFLAMIYRLLVRISYRK